MNARTIRMTGEVIVVVQHSASSVIFCPDQACVFDVTSNKYKEEVYYAHGNECSNHPDDEKFTGKLLMDVDDETKSIDQMLDDGDTRCFMFDCDEDDDAECKITISLFQCCYWESHTTSEMSAQTCRECVENGADYEQDY